jgi:hypothetical protein
MREDVIGKMEDVNKEKTIMSFRNDSEKSSTCDKSAVDMSRV